MFSAGDCNNEIVLSSSEARMTQIWAGVVFVVVIKHIMFLYITFCNTAVIFKKTKH